MTHPRFNLDPAKAGDWLARVIAYNENDAAPTDDSMPTGLTAAWHAPTDDGATIDGLVASAVAAGIITAEGIDAAIAYEHLDGGLSRDDLSRVLVTVDPDTESALTLASVAGPATWVAPDGMRGADSALEVLHYVANEGTDLLARLLSYAATYASTEVRRARRQGELSRLPASTLRDLYRRGITRPDGRTVQSLLTVGELGAWKKEELVSHILGIEFPGC